MTFTDRLFLAKLGPEQMNAAMGGGVMMQTMMFFFIGLTGYSTALAAQYYGSGRKQMAPVTAFQAMLVVLASYPVILSMLPVAKWLFGVMNVPASQVVYQNEYITVLAAGSVAALLRHALGCYFSGIGRTPVVMLATLAAMTVNVVLDYILIFGKFGAPALGMRGAAMATVAGSALAVVILAAFYFSSAHRHEFGVMKSFRINLDVMKKLLYYGYPAGVEFFMNFLAFTMMVILFHSQGEHVATASTIMFNWDMVSFIPLVGIEIAVTSLVGRYMGAGDHDSAHRAAMSGIRTGVWYSLVMLVAFFFFPELLVNVFRPSGESGIFEQAIPVAVLMVRIAAVYVIAEAVVVALTGALRGAGDTHWTMVASVSFHWSSVPLLYIIFNVLGLSAIVAWSLIVTAFMVFSVVLVLRYRGGKWRRMKVV